MLTFLICIILAPIALAMFVRLLLMPAFWAFVLVLTFCGVVFWQHEAAQEKIRIAQIEKQQQLQNESEIQRDQQRKELEAQETAQKVREYQQGIMTSEDWRRYFEKSDAEIEAKYSQSTEEKWHRK